MNPAVTIGMKQYTVGHAIASAKDPPDELMAAPSCHPRNLMAALGTQSVLSEPQAEKLISPSWTCFHLQVKATLEVRFPSRVVGVSVPLYLNVSDDEDGCGAKEGRESWFPIFIARSLPKDKATIDPFEVLVTNPPRRFVAMSPVRPAPQTSEDSPIHLAEHSRARDVAVIVSPASNDGVEQRYQDSGLRLLVGFDDSTDFHQKSF